MVTISQLIALLQKVQAEHGDLPVCLEDSEHTFGGAVDDALHKDWFEVRPADRNERNHKNYPKRLVIATWKGF